MSHTASDLLRAKEFALLIRPDLRSAIAKESNSNFFDYWWLIRGKKDYPAWAAKPTEEQLSILFSSDQEIMFAGTKLAMPKVVEWLARLRPDAVKIHSRGNQGLDLESFFSWTFARALAEHSLAAFTPDRWVGLLDAPVPATLPKDYRADTVPAATLLMYCVWRILDEKARGQLAIDNPQARFQFIAWYFCSAKSLGLTPMIAGRWKAWLQMPVALSGSGDEIPRFAQLALMTNADLRKKVTTKGAMDATRLRAWATTAIAPGQPWHWLMIDERSAGLDSDTEGLETDALALSVVDISERPVGVNLYGFAYGELGIGEDLRMAVEACAAAGIAYHVVNIDPGKHLRQGDDHLEDLAQDAAIDKLPPYAVNVFCMPAFDTASRVYLPLGSRAFSGYINVGWWPWELPVFPKAWRNAAFGMIDEIWAGSRFSMASYKAATNKPVHHIPLAASVARGKRYGRKHYGLAETKFLFLFIFDFNSYLARKNPFAAVEAFCKAFNETDKKVGLVIKVMNGRDQDPRWKAFLEACAKDRRVQLISGTLDRSEVLGLIRVCDAYVSLHRSEGFGRTLAEAMLYGKPVVATKYSGNTDFMHPKLTFAVRAKEVPVAEGEYPWITADDNAVWAEPDLTHAAQQMRAARLAAKEAEFAKNVKAFAKEHFDSGRIGKMMRNRITQLIADYRSDKPNFKKPEFLAK